jgi:hypothetical protein
MFLEMFRELIPCWGIAGLTSVQWHLTSGMTT